MNQIINSILDNDIYKFSVMNYALTLFPEEKVEYRFKNRGEQSFSPEFLKELQNQINSLNTLSLTQEEYVWMKNTFSYFPPTFFEYLKNFKYNPKNVTIKLTKDNNLDLIINGKWCEVVLFEIVLMSIISELYFKIHPIWSHVGQRELADNKITALSEAGCQFIEFGTRRRRDIFTQEVVISSFCNYAKNNNNSTFLGTSNVYFAKKYNIQCFGSVPHEQIQAAQVLNSYNHCNYYAMENWIKVYPNVEIGTALSDTIGVSAFLQDFNRKQSILFKATRQDSGCPFEYTDRIINHYKKMNINPKEKTIIFSDSLDVKKAIQIKNYCEEKIQCSFGIGTHLTGDFGEKSPPLNMVIKLWSVNNIPCVKLSEAEGKEMGDPKAIEYMKWIIKNQTL